MTSITYDILRLLKAKQRQKHQPFRLAQRYATMLLYALHLGCMSVDKNAGLVCWMTQQYQAAEFHAARKLNISLCKLLSTCWRIWSGVMAELIFVLLYPGWCTIWSSNCSAQVHPTTWKPCCCIPVQTSEKQEETHQKLALDGTQAIAGVVNVVTAQEPNCEWACDQVVAIRLQRRHWCHCDIGLYQQCEWSFAAASIAFLRTTTKIVEASMALLRNHGSQLTRAQQQEWTWSRSTDGSLGNLH
jgi:hypothetical protein